jgi:hypothetical protein
VALLALAMVGCGAAAVPLRPTDGGDDAGLPPGCRYTFTPQDVNFGEVKPGVVSSALVTVANVGADSCAVTNLALGPGTDPAFSLPDGPIDSQVIPPQGTLQVTVAFSPQVDGEYAGTLDFSIDDPSAPIVTIVLAGVGYAKCVVFEPVNLDFGVVGLTNGQYCANGKRKFVGINGCDEPVQITSVTLHEHYDAFALLSAPSLPLTIPAGSTSAPFEVGFAPQDAGNFVGTILVQTDAQATAFGVYMQGSAVTGSMQTDVFNTEPVPNFFAPSVDVLFVLNTSQSAFELALLSADATDFLAAIPAGVNVQIGVTTTDVCGAAGSEDGRLLPCPGCKISGSAPTLIRAGDPNAASDLAALLLAGGAQSDGCQVGVNDTQFFQAVDDALGRRAIAGFYNQAFLQPGVQLAIVAASASDQDDDSPQSTGTYVDDLDALVGGDANLLSFSLAARGEAWQLPPRLSAVVSGTGGLVADTQSATWEAELAGLWDLVLTRAYTFPATAEGDVVSDGETVTVTAVTVDGDSLPQGDWTYQAASNTVVIDHHRVRLWPGDHVGIAVKVTYQLICD